MKIIHEGSGGIPRQGRDYFKVSLKRGKCIAVNFKGGHPHIKYREANCQTQKQTLPGILYADISAPMLSSTIFKPLSLIDQGG